MKENNRTLLFLCSLFVIFNISDAVITIYIIQNGLGIEANRLLLYIIKNTSLYHTMGLKILFITVAMSIIYTMDGKYDTLYLRGHKIKGINVVYFGLVFINLMYCIIVINGLFVIIFSTPTPL